MESSTTTSCTARGNFGIPIKIFMKETSKTIKEVEKEYIISMMGEPTKETLLIISSKGLVSSLGKTEINTKAFSKMETSKKE